MFGYILGLVLVFSKKQFSLLINLVFILIMFIDWFIQYKEFMISNNTRRIFTGLLCGVGIIGSFSTILRYIL